MADYLDFEKVDYLDDEILVYEKKVYDIGRSIKLPFEDVAPVVHAYWKLTANKNHNICAYCGTFAPLWFDDDGERIEWLSNYCPKCGAKMDEEVEEWQDSLIRIN